MISHSSQILIVDDEINLCTSCQKILSKMGCQAEYALNGYDGLQAMQETEFDLIVTDLKMSSMGGMELIRRVKQSHPETIVIVMTGYASVASAVEVMKLGAFDYLSKPFTPEELRGVVQKGLEERSLRRKNRELSTDREKQLPISHQLIGESSKIQSVVRMIRKVAPTDSTVLVYGESGTGKELIARAIHANSNRTEKVFFALDCGTLSESLLESELFGHVKGAFTGAHQDREGVFKKAHQGTVFLDEISNISQEVQGKLLRFLEEREFLPLGGVKVQNVDVRLIFATNQDLQKMVAAGEFREDFYYRIFVYPIMVPPLRERREDILPIAYAFLDQFNRSLNKKISRFEDQAVVRLTEYTWPGNVRELRNVVERAVIACETERVGVQDLALPGGSGEPLGPVPGTNEELKQMKKEVRQKAVNQVERNFLLKALMDNDWNVTQAAEKVGLQRTNFHNLMKKHGISRSDQTGGDDV